MNTVFWNVDTQYDFMRPDGALYVKGAETIEGNLEKLTRFARKNDIKIINTADWHNKQTEEITSGMFKPHCMQGTKGAEYVSATRPKNPYIVDWEKESLEVTGLFKNKELILRKDKFDVFAGNKWADVVVTLLRPEQAVVYGVATNVCVNDAVLGLLKRGVKVYVPLDAVKELPKEVPVPGLEETIESWLKNGAILTDTNSIVTGESSIRYKQ